MTDIAALDIVTIGRSSVDLYGEQVGGRLEDMASFAKYVGGSPTNTAVGLARLGLKPGLLTRVGNDHFGRFIREQSEHFAARLAREAGEDTQARIELAYRLALARPVANAERATVSAFLEKHAERIEADAKSTGKAVDAVIAEKVLAPRT